MTESQKSAAGHALEGAFAVADGKYIDAARHFAEAALDLVPTTVFRQIIDDAAARRANAIALEAENAKFGPEKTP